LPDSASRNWLRHNALGIGGGIGLGLAVVAGWHWMQQHQQQQAMAASEAYTQIVQQFEAGKLPADQGRSAIARLEQDTPALATLAALQLARAQVESGKRDEAIATLRGLRQVPEDLRPVLNVRLARLLLDAGKAKEALPLLGDARNPEMLELLGDARFALGELTQAQEAYRKALVLVEVGNVQHRVLEMKLTQAGGTPPHTEDTP